MSMVGLKHVEQHEIGWSIAERLKLATARCVERYGIQKTTVKDIAHEAGVSRALVYRHFKGREHLLMAVLRDRSDALRDRASRFTSEQPTLADAIVEGLLFLAQHGRRDAFMRHLVEGDDARATQQLLRRSGAGGRAAAAFWAPVFDRFEHVGELAGDVDRESAYEWLAELGLLLMSHLQSEPEEEEMLRRRLRGFVWPAFARLPCGPVPRPAAWSAP